MLRNAVGFAICLTLAACASGPQWYEEGEIQAVEIGNIRNVTQFGERVYFAGQPTEADFKLLADRGVQKVINLRTDEEMQRLGFDEKAAAEAAGLEYVQIPIGQDEPTEAQIQQIMNELEDAENAPVLMHCASANRVGYAWSMFRGTRGGVTPDEAIEEGKKIGLSNKTLEERSRAYIEKH